MALKDSILNIVIRAKDLAGNTLKKFRSELAATEKQSGALSTGLGRLKSAVVTAVAGFASFQGIKAGLLAVLGTGDRFERMAIQMQAVMGSIADGERATEWITEFTKSTPLQLEQATEAFVRLKSFGLDPMDGSLQAIVDQNEKLGGGYERLQGIVNAFGQAWAKQKLQGEEILQLVERGVPVYDLLAQATGKNARELQKMQEAGQLTRSTIRDVIAAMGAASTGSAAANMETLTGIVSNLRDEWSQWLAKVADQGALESFKVELRNLQAVLGGLAADGSLARWARSVSEAIAGLLAGVKASIVFVKDYGAELALLAKAFLVIKVAQVTKAMAAFGLQMVASSGQARNLTSSLAAATAALGRLQLAFAGLGTFLVGWQIGTYLRERFVEVKRLSYDLVGVLLKSWERLKFGWEAVQAVFTDDTIEAAQTRLQAKLQEIDVNIADLKATAGQAGDALKGMAKDAGEAGQAAADATKMAAAGVAEVVSEAQSKMTDALDKLDVDMERVKNKMSTVGAEAIAAFSAVVDAQSKIGEEVEIQSRTVREAYIKAFEDIETEVGKKKLFEALQEALKQGVISAHDFNEAIAQTQRETDNTAQSFLDLRNSAGEAAKAMAEAGRQGAQMGEQVAAGAAQGSSAAALITGALEGYRAQLEDLSTNAAEAFDALATGAQRPQDEIEQLQHRSAALAQEIRDIRFESLKLADTSGLQTYLKGVRKSAREVEESFVDQRLALLDLNEGYESGRYSAEQFVQRAEQMIRTSDLLDQQDLSNLRRGIDAATASMERLQQQAANTLRSLRNELDTLEGRTAEVERRNYEQRIDELNRQLDMARRTGSEEAKRELEEALRVAEEIYAIERRRAEQADRQAAARAREQASAGEARSTSNSVGDRRRPHSLAEQVIRLELGDQSTQIRTSDRDGLLDLLEGFGLRTN